MRTIVKGRICKTEYRADKSSYYINVEYRNYFVSNNLDYILKRGDYFNGHIIEIVEGMEDNCINYYTTRILTLDGKEFPHRSHII